MDQDLLLVTIFCVSVGMEHVIWTWCYLRPRRGYPNKSSLSYDKAFHYHQVGRVYISGLVTLACFPNRQLNVLACGTPVLLSEITFSCCWFFPVITFGCWSRYSLYLFMEYIYIKSMGKSSLQGIDLTQVRGLCLLNNVVFGFPLVHL